MNARFDVIFLILFLIVPRVLMGQSSGKSHLPSASNREGYEAGTVWVKLKEIYKGIFEGNASVARMPVGISALQVKPFLHPKSRNKSQARLAPHKLHVNIALYFQISYDKSIALEDYIEDLYKTGYFDIVEPVSTVQPFLIPNDPSSSQQYYLDLIHAYEAWDITQGSESIVIGIVDTGGDLDHPDLQSNLYIDPAEPIDGIDNDGDGYIDNNRGWDFSGADVTLIGTPGFIGDNDPSISQGNLFAHGTKVAGCASASTDNGIGISGIGYKTKLLFTKHFADNQPGSNFSSNLYNGILYAATHGAKIINCSWGNYNFSTIAQDIITYVTLDLGCLVIAAAGNSNLETPIYPAGYKHVVSVASCDENDLRAPLSNFGKTIDITSPGRFIYTTDYNDGYATESGTSMAAPIVAGAAALVWAHNPSYTPLQVAEQLRVSADEGLYVKNPSYLHKLGKGRLDVYRALTVQSPSVRAANQSLLNTNDISPAPGESTKLYFDFTNYLRTTSGELKVTLSSNSPFVTITKAEVGLGVLEENRTVRNTSSPFEFTLSPSLPVDHTIEALLTYSDGTYQDFQIVNFIIPSYIDVNENNILTSITSTGRLGFTNTETQSNGSGFIYNEQNLMYEIGLIMGTSASDISNNVRGINGIFDQDFTSNSRITKHTPGERSYSEVTGSFSNSIDIGSASLDISYRSLVWTNDPYKDFVILEYKIKNVTDVEMEDFFFGVFADWDLSPNGINDRASWENETKLGYVFSAESSTLVRTGIQVLSGREQYYAIDNDPTISGNPFGIYDGFTDAEKFTSVSSGQLKTQAGDIVNGGDVSHVVGSGPYTIHPGEEVTIAFAMHASNTNPALLVSAKYADSLYNYTLKAPTPVVKNVESCYGGQAILNATGATKFNWYKDFTGGDIIFSGSEFTTTNLFSDTVFFVSNADESYESLRTPAYISVKPNPVVDVFGNLEFCEGEVVQLSTGEADEYLWSNGEITQHIQVAVSGVYSVTVLNGTLACTSTENVSVTVDPKPSAAFEVSSDYPGPKEEIVFSLVSSGAATWFWDFGDGNISTEEEPVHTYMEDGEYTVILTVTSDKKCTSVESKSFGIVTSTEGRMNESVQIYPNPVGTDQLLYITPRETSIVSVSIFSVQGDQVYHSTLTDPEEISIDVSGLSNGVYILKYATSEGSMMVKIILTR